MGRKLDSNRLVTFPLWCLQQSLSKRKNCNENNKGPLKGLWSCLHNATAAAWIFPLSVHKQKTEILITISMIASSAVWKRRFLLEQDAKLAFPFMWLSCEAAKKATVKNSFSMKHLAWMGIGISRRVSFSLGVGSCKVVCVCLLTCWSSKCPNSDVFTSCVPVLMFSDQCELQKAAWSRSFPIPIWTTWKYGAQSDPRVCNL